MAVPDRTSEDGLPGASWLVSRFNSELESFLDEHAKLLVGLHPDLGLLADASRASVMFGGKRLRPTFVYWGWRTGQEPDAAGETALIRAAASLELLHACALVHDDVLDSSDTRRGQPAAHIRFAREHCRQKWPGQSAAFGTAGAILLGDLLLSWAEEMFTAAISELPTDRSAPAIRQFDLMRTEVVGGQFLDVLAQTRGAFDPVEALRVIEFKTSKYTIQRPLLLGAAAAGASQQLLDVLAGYGRALGEAFQLRDDLLGVFGDPSQTGKPAGDDLREGKRTLLVALAVRAASDEQRAQLLAGVGNPDLDAAGVASLQTILIATGARRAVEDRITDQARRAENVLSSLTPDQVTDADEFNYAAGSGAGRISTAALTALLDLAHAAAHRTF
ncbi:polyprenyl synthetase family protein [Jatrophihabitans sp. DSM 45814]